MKKDNERVNIKINEKSVSLKDRTIPIVDGKYKEELDKLVNKNKMISIYNDIGFIQNEIIEIPKIDDKYKNKFISKEIYKKESEKLLVGARIIDKNHILVSRIEKGHVNTYLEIAPKSIKSIYTVVDLVLSRVNKNKEFIILKDYKFDIELVIWSENLKDIVRIKKDEDFDLNLLYLDIRNILSKEIDTSIIETIYMDFEDESIKDILDLNNNIEIESIDSIINIDSYSEDKNKAINFVNLNAKKNFNFKIPSLNIILIVILIFVSLFNINKYFVNRDKLSSDNIDSLIVEIEEEKEILGKELEKDTSTKIDNVGGVLKFITKKVPRDVFIENIYIENKNQRIEGNSKKRENIVLFYNNLNKENKYELEQISQDKDNKMFRFSIRTRLEGEDSYE